MGITPISCRFNNSISIPKNYHIIRRVEKQMLNERVRSINQTLYLCEFKREACYTRLKNIIQDRKVLQQCSSLIDRVKEVQHSKIKLKQMAKFNKLSAKQL